MHTTSSVSGQEFVELKQVENLSDSEEYPSLEGHSRAASLPRLNAEYYVSSSGLLVLLLTEKDLIASVTVVCRLSRVDVMM